MIENVSLADLSIANLTVGGGHPVELIEAAAANGFGAVGLVVRSAMAKPLHTEIIGHPESMRAIKQACAANRVHVFDVEAFVLGVGVDVESYRPALEAGAELGATHISAIGTELAGNDRVLEAQARVDLFGQLCDAAAECDLHVGVEFMLYRDVATMAEALALIEAAGRPNAGLILDVLHLRRSGGRVADVAHIPRGRVAYAQLCDIASASPALIDLPGEARTARLHLGHGVADLDGLLDVLPATTPLVIETPVLAEAGQSLRDKVRNAAMESASFFERHRLRRGG